MLASSSAAAAPSWSPTCSSACPSVTHVACVHCETTTGVLNPLRELGLVAARHRRRFLADAVSSFGAYPVGPGKDIDFGAGPIDHLVSTANKCIEGVPGFAEEVAGAGTARA